jgi:hypothetical protein
MSELLQPNIRKVIDKYNANQAWYSNNYQLLKQKYKGQIILIIDENNVEGYKDSTRLQKRLEKGDIDKRTIVIDYINDSDAPMIV